MFFSFLSKSIIESVTIAIHVECDILRMRPLNKRHPLPPPSRRREKKQTAVSHSPFPTSPYPTDIKARANQAATCFLQRELIQKKNRNT